MNARALLEAIFSKGAAFFDTSGKGYLSVTGTLFIPMTGNVSDAVRDFVEFWSRGKSNRQQLMQSPGKTVEHMVANHGLVGVFVTKRGLGLISANERITLNDYQREWLMSRFQIVADTPVFWSRTFNGQYEETNAEFAMFGGMTKPAREKFLAKRNDRKKSEEEYEEFTNGIENRAKGLPGLLTAGPRSGSLRVTQQAPSAAAPRPPGAPNPKGTPISFLRGSGGFKKTARIYGV
jgi:hypothetical protein